MILAPYFLAFILLSVSSVLADYDISRFPIKAIDIQDAKNLSSWTTGFPTQKVEKLLQRARKEGYTHVLSFFEPKVWGEGYRPNQPAGNNDNVFYRYARVNGGKPVHYFKEAFEKAAEYHLILIPEIALFSGRCQWHNRWVDLHPAELFTDSTHRTILVDCKSQGGVPSIQLNYYDDPRGNGATPLADDDYHGEKVPAAAEGFYKHLYEFYADIKKEYDAARFPPDFPKPATLPYIKLEFDEVWASDQGQVAFLLGQQNVQDQQFIWDTVNKYKGSVPCSKKAVTAAVKRAISSLLATRFYKETIKIKGIFGDSCKVICGGNTFDPQNNGGSTHITSFLWNYGNSRKKDPDNSSQYIYNWTSDRTAGHYFSGSKWNAKSNPIADYATFNVSESNGIDPLDLPGLTAGQKDTVWESVIFSPWQYGMYWNAYPDLKQIPYSWSTTYDYFKNRGFAFIPMSALSSDPFQAAEPKETDNTVQAMRMTLTVLNDTQYSLPAATKQFAYGFFAAWWPCDRDKHLYDPDYKKAEYYEPNGTVTTLPNGRRVTSTRCRCNNTGFPWQWNDGKDPYAAQPFEFNAMEYMLWFAKGKSGMPPRPGSFRRDSMP